jgi:FkbM family methyltransferase
MIINRLKNVIARIILGRKTVKKVQLVRSSEVVDSFSQYGEDLVIDSLLGNVERGIYIDVGANDPRHCSNTYRFYKKGWSGVNIEPQPLLFKRFEAERPHDINLNLGIASIRSELKFYELDSDKLSTFDYNLAIKNGERFSSKIIKEFMVSVRTLSDVLNQCFPTGQEISFFSIDTEGFDLEVLKGNDWTRFKPKLIVIELGDDQLEIDRYLTELGYFLVYMNGTNGIFFLK